MYAYVHISNYFDKLYMVCINRRMDIQLICDESKGVNQYEFVYDREENPGYYHYVRACHTNVE